MLTTHSARLFLFCLFIGFNTQAADNAHRWQSLYGDTIAFDVYRKNVSVGTYTTSFIKNSDNELIVDIKMQLEIPIIFSWTYDYRYTAREQWQSGVLKKLEVTIDDDGDIKQLVGENSQGKLQGDFAGEPFSVDLPILLTHHYNADVLDDNRVFNTLTARENSVIITDAGEQEVTAGNKNVEAGKYDYNGDLTDTSVWYDRHNRWIKMRFLGSDGIPIELRCKRCGQQ